MKFFKISYIEGGKTREKYCMLEKQPELKQVVETELAVELLHPDIGYGGIYGGATSRYTLFIPENSKIEEVPLTDFVNVLLESLKKNYVSKSRVKDLVGLLISSQE
jgi:hypothetical protein